MDVVGIDRCLECDVLFAGHERIGVIWIFITYLPQVIAGSILYPIGNALVGRLSPPRMEGTLMATWQLLGQGMDAFFSGKLALLAALPSTGLLPAMTNPIYAKALAIIGGLGLAAALVCWLRRRFISSVV